MSLLQNLKSSSFVKVASVFVLGVAFTASFSGCIGREYESTIVTPNTTGDGSNTTLGGSNTTLGGSNTTIGGSSNTTIGGLSNTTIGG